MGDPHARRRNGHVHGSIEQQALVLPVRHTRVSVPSKRRGLISGSGMPSCCPIRIAPASGLANLNRRRSALMLGGVRRRLSADAPSARRNPRDRSGGGGFRMPGYEPHPSCGDSAQEVAGRVRVINKMVVGVSSLADCKLLGWRGRAGETERQNIPKNRCRTTIAEPIGENASETGPLSGIRSSA